MGFELPYEFTITALAPVAPLWLYKLTGEHRYLEGIAIPMAAILRHSWRFNPDYGDYRGRTIFRLTEAMTAIYANGWEEAALIHYLNDFLVEGRDVLPASVREMTAALLRWKGVSVGNSLPPLLPDPSIIYMGIPREWYIPVNRAWVSPSRFQRLPAICVGLLRFRDRIEARNRISVLILDVSGNLPPLASQESEHGDNGRVALAEWRSRPVVLLSVLDVLCDDAVVVLANIFDGIATRRCEMADIEIHADIL